MSEYIKITLKLCWGILLTYWLVSSLSAKKVAHQESFLKRFLSYWFPIIIALLLLGPSKWFGHSFLRENFIEHTNLVGVIGLLFSVPGTIIACWARYKLGRNWSVSVQKKENHELIQGGIYKYIRHPIYTGLLMLFLGNVLIVGDYRGFLAIAIVFVSFWIKLKKEEKLLTQIFGTVYTQYKKKTKALFPYFL